MSHARLLSVEVTQFKSYRERTRLDLKPLTVLVGRNNSGKSTMVQALLLLKQTLESPRTEVPLNLVGTVEALSLRELTHGWPETVKRGPIFRLEWESRLDLDLALDSTVKTSAKTLIESGIVGLSEKAQSSHATVTTTLTVRFAEDGRRVRIDQVGLTSHESDIYASHLDVGIYPSEPRIRFGTDRADHIGIEWDHFLPHLTLDRTSLGPRHQDRIRHNLWLFRFQQPLADLRALLRGFGFLGSTRSLPPTLYRVSASDPPDHVGVSGEYAADLLHARRSDIVHYLPPIALSEKSPVVAEAVQARPLVEAVNHVFSAMGLDGRIAVEDVKDLGFQILFGKATLQHVGRGLTYLLPLVEYGLLLDPKRFEGTVGEQSREDFLASLTSYSLAAFEEPEAHIHPKLQSQLAHWFVALAMCGRNLIVETHSDHMVRRLRRLMARAPQGSPLETWLRENVAIVEVSQAKDGSSSLVSSALTTRGDFERWPADFMDVATDEEREIYDAALDKPEAAPAREEPSAIVHDEGEEPGDD
jgi:hypothetical protein